MHYIDRKNCNNPPLDLLKKLDEKYKVLWVEYHKSKYNPNIKNLSRPNTGWSSNKIRHPLGILFYKNCGYCGIHTDLGSDAEIDHHFPISLNLLTDKIYCWHNYIWSCHSCNNIKNKYYPFLDPCLKSDIKYIYFNESDGKYMCYINAPSDIKEKFENTEEYSNLNDKNRPDARKCLSRDVLQIYLSALKMSHKLYIVEKDIQGEDASETEEALKVFHQKKDYFLDFIKSGNYLFLIKDIFEIFCIENSCDFPFTFEELLDETDYLKIDGYS
ncbi:MAG: hypothetical protein QM493_01450 [Sulfurovum sp.]